jgi:GNAT superfamily N-acetyltransferase
MGSRDSLSQAAAPSIERLTFHEVDRGRWRDLARLFDAPGGPKYCWCMSWRPLENRSRPGGNQRRRAALQRRVRAGVPVGILAYVEGVPIAWCSVAPRETFRPLGGPEADGDAVWSVVCFFVPRRLRRRGLMRRLLAAAIESARRHGATVVEAYPVDPDSPSYRFMGYVPLFRSSGFAHVGRAGSRRRVMRLDLSGTREVGP